jgi:hypothetical protein
MNTDRELRIDELLAKQEIADAMARYARGIDRRDEELVRSAYHEDSVDEHGWGFTGPGWGLAAATRLDGTGFPVDWLTTTHFLGQSHVEVDGDEAASETYFISYTRVKDEQDTPWDVVIAGRYVDRWERREDGFKVSHRKVVYDWVRTDEVRTMWPGPDPDVAKSEFGGAPIDVSSTIFGKLFPDDPSYQVLSVATAPQAS